MNELRIGEPIQPGVESVLCLDLLLMGNNSITRDDVGGAWASGEMTIRPVLELKDLVMDEVLRCCHE